MENQRDRTKKFIIENMIYIFVVVLFVISAISSKNFIKPVNLANLIRQYTPYTLLSMGMLVVLLTGGIDLSVGSVVAFNNVIFAILVTSKGMGTGTAIILTLLIGIGVGAVNGYLIAFRKLPPFIATLATMSIFESMSFVVTNAKSIRYESAGLKTFGKLGFIVGDVVIPLQLFVIAIVIFLFWFMLNKTAFGRLIYATGSNSQAVVLSGINHKVILFSVYCISGLCAAASALVSLSRMNVATSTLGSGYEMDAIASCVIGGVCMTGGKGSAVKTLCGVFILAMIGNIMNLLGIPNYPQNAIKGVIIILAVMFQDNK